MKVILRNVLGNVLLGLLTAVIWGVALFPLWLFLIVKHLTDPEGFWQNFVMFSFGLWALGGLQIVLFLVGLAVTFVIFSKQ